jgi:diguanylate cyclase
MSEQVVKLLIVDDDEDDTYLIVDALQQVTRTRYAITTAASPLKAMAELAKQTFDVIFSDYRLGALTGVDFINSVRNAHIETPIILLTGISDHLVDNAALKAGSSDFICKTGLTPDVLDRSVRYALAHADRQRMLRTILKSAGTGIAVIEDDGTISLCNDQFTSLAQLALDGAPDANRQLVDRIKAEATKDLVVGQLVFEAHLTELPDGKAIIALNDVTQRVNDLRERQRAEERIRNVAMKDGLTSLPNRMAFEGHLDACLSMASEQNDAVAVLLFDFNRFKDINDLFGHAAGDHILKTAAEKLNAVMTGREYAARLGGDEFVVIQTESTQEDALALAHRVAETMSFNLNWEGKLIEGSVTVGVALYPSQGKTRQELLGNADLAMYRGKSQKDDSVCMFDVSMDHFIRDRRALAHELRHALLRWNSPARGLVSPARFIPIAEENGLIFDIDLWVLDRACKLLSEHLWVPRLAVNISSKAICQPHIVTKIRSALVSTGISPNRLELEITETALVQDANRALHNLRQIKALGISVAMDDFGTGYSSLSLLSSFPFDRIKIDGSFIHSTGTNDRADEVFRAVVGLGAALRVPVLVEGVETAEQFAFAEQTGCTEIQGFYTGRPVGEALLPKQNSEHDNTQNVRDFTKLGLLGAVAEIQASGMKLAV